MWKQRIAALACLIGGQAVAQDWRVADMGNGFGATLSSRESEACGGQPAILVALCTPSEAAVVLTLQCDQPKPDGVDFLALRLDDQTPQIMAVLVGAAGRRYGIFDRDRVIALIEQLIESQTLLIGIGSDAPQIMLFDTDGLGATLPQTNPACGITGMIAP